ncbi:hypothetical protein EJ06DRAFT_534395 [Trichodelitschia bisporula]|uniref:Uncharacterized protein n=1 Tax=Trichodelitschia bisporula TaxID=703511 RepID=A0A6G1HJA8_9PEZI|nr:hypothetical protein EJ06DRAFT_534395 [Trichodelitschia bisporula]
MVSRASVLSPILRLVSLRSAESDLETRRYAGKTCCSHAIHRSLLRTRHLMPQVKTSTLSSARMAGIGEHPEDWRKIPDRQTIEPLNHGKHSYL